MADQPAQERTEQPTPRRLTKAREEGQVARSQELMTVTVLAAGAGAILLGHGAIGREIGATVLLMQNWLAAPPMTGADAATILRGTTRSTFVALVPVLAMILAPVLLVGAAQARGVLSLKPITPQWSRINPGKGLKRLFGLEGWFTLLKAILKLLVLGAILWAVLVSAWPMIAALTGAGAGQVLAVFRAATTRLALGTGVAFLAIALIDVLFTRHRHQRQLRMTRQELVQEHRETEGDPLLKSRIKSLAMQLSRKRMLQHVKDADVVVVNPTHIAVALRYDPAFAGAPVVVAMGRRKLAERIRTLAREARVPVVENVAVARALIATARVGQPIPPALYTAIAEILAFVYRTHGRMPAALAGGRPA